MEAMFQYSLAVSVAMLTLYAVYRLVLAREARPAANRLALLLIYLTSFALFPAMAWLQRPLTRILYAPTSPTADTATPDVMHLPSEIWLVGAACAVLLTLAELIKIALIVRRCSTVEYEGHKIRLTDDERIAPFSLGSIIVMSRRDFDTATRAIIMHESAHQHYRHTADMMLAQLAMALCWYNPAAWLLRSELRAVHEYQADRRVLDSDYDARSYQLFLIGRAAGHLFPGMAHRLDSCRLGRRIAMMNSPATHTPLRYALLLVGLVAAAGAYSVSAVRIALTPASAISIVDARTVKKPAESAPSDEVEIKADEKKLRPEDITYYVDGQPITREELNNIPSDRIKAISVNKDDARIEIEMRH